MTGEEPGAATLAQRIEALFGTVRHPEGRQYSNEEVARACREATGESFSAVYVWQLRTGRRDNPTKRHLEALARFFRVPVAYFFDDEQGAQAARDVELLAALREAGVRNLALWAGHLSPEGLDTISDLIDVLVRRERAARRSRRADDEDLGDPDGPVAPGDFEDPQAPGTP